MKHIIDQLIVISSTYFFKLLKLSIPELIQSVSVPFLHSAQAHVTDAVTHLSHIQQSWA